MVESRISPSRRGTMLLADLGVLLWVAIWIIVAILVSGQVRQLTTLSDTLSTSGGSLVHTGAALRSEAELPLIGSRIAEVADQLTTAGRQAQTSARITRDSVQRLGVLLGATVAGVAVMPVLFGYIPFRIVRARRRAAVERVLFRARSARAPRPGSAA